MVIRFQSNLKCTSLIHFVDLNLETIRWSSPTLSEVIGHYHINFINFQYRKAFCLRHRISSKPQIHKSHSNTSCTQFSQAAYLEISSLTFHRSHWTAPSVNSTRAPSITEKLLFKPAVRFLIRSILKGLLRLRGTFHLHGPSKQVEPGRHQEVPHASAPRWHPSRRCARRMLNRAPAVARVLSVIRGPGPLTRPRTVPFGTWPWLRASACPPVCVWNRSAGTGTGSATPHSVARRVCQGVLYVQPSPRTPVRTPVAIQSAPARAVPGRAQAGRAQAGTDAAASHSTQTWGCYGIDRTSRACSVRDAGPSARDNVPTPPQPILVLYIVGGGSPQLYYHDYLGTTSQVTRQGRHR